MFFCNLMEEEVEIREEQGSRRIHIFICRFQHQRGRSLTDSTGRRKYTSFYLKRIFLSILFCKWMEVEIRVGQDSRCINTFLRQFQYRQDKSSIHLTDKCSCTSFYPKQTFLSMFFCKLVVVEIRAEPACKYICSWLYRFQHPLDKSSIDSMGRRKYKSFYPKRIFLNRSLSRAYY